MKNAEKLVLVPIEKYERLQEYQKNNNFGEELSDLNELDTKLFDILKKKIQNEKEKAEMYKEVINQYFIDTPLSSKLKEEEEEEEEEPVKSSNEDMDTDDSYTTTNPPGLKNIDQLGEGNLNENSKSSPEHLSKDIKFKAENPFQYDSDNDNESKLPKERPPGIVNMDILKKKKKKKIMKWKRFDIRGK